MIRWDKTGDVHHADVPGGRYAIKRTAKRSRTFEATWNGEPTSFRGATVEHVMEMCEHATKLEGSGSSLYEVGQRFPSRYIIKRKGHDHPSLYVTVAMSTWTAFRSEAGDFTSEMADRFIKQFNATPVGQRFPAAKLEVGPRSPVPSLWLAAWASAYDQPEIGDNQLIDWADQAFPNCIVLTSRSEATINAAKKLALVDFHAEDGAEGVAANRFPDGEWKLQASGAHAADMMTWHYVNGRQVLGVLIIQPATVIGE
jgi:hypothetical protein